VPEKGQSLISLYFYKSANGVVESQLEAITYKIFG
jgi:hypothetical protein